MAKGYIITLDGPAASGKSHLAHELREKLHGVGIPVGALYRSIALYCFRKGVVLDNEEAVSQQLPQLEVVINGDTIILNGEDVTKEISHEEISMAASQVASIPSVRAYVLKVEQTLGKRLASEGRIVIVEGRVAGIKEFPNADVKLFLHSSVEERARRRTDQLERDGSPVPFERVLRDIKERDQHDMTRDIDPMVDDPDRFGYVSIDNTHFTPEQTLEEALRVIKEKGITV